MNDKECPHGKCPMSCYECWLAGDSVPDWEQRKVCRKLDEKIVSDLEGEGGICIDDLLPKQT